MGQQYHIKVYNYSEIDDQKAIVFQQQPDLPADVHSLAWFSKTWHAGTSLDFYWTLDFNFVWGQEGDLMPGVDYQAGQIIDADLTSKNKVTLDYVDGGFKFGPVGPGPAHGQGSLFISQGDNVPGFGNRNQGSVGIGMSGAGTFVTPTNPDGGGGTQFTIRPTYWIGFGSHAAGTVVTQDILRFPQELQFPAGEFNAECLFDGKAWKLTYQ